MVQNSIINVKYEDSAYATFLWDINKSVNTSWTHESPIIFFDKSLTKECFIRIQWQYNSSGTYNVTLELHFVQSHLCFKDATFVVIIYFSENPNKGYAFNLKQDSTNDKLFVSVRIAIYESYYDNYRMYTIKNLRVKISNNILRKLSDNNTKISNNLKNLLEKEEHADFKIKVQDKIFNVHKCILSSRCNVLAKMIESDMLEKKRGEIYFEDLDPIVVKELLNYLYTAEYDVAKMPHELFKLAHYLELPELENGCKRYLMDNINLKNIINKTELADEEQYYLADLQKVARTFITTHESTLVLDLDFQEYLCRSIRINNIVLVLRLAHKYDLKVPLNCAMEFVKLNYKQVLQNSECKDFFSKNADLMIKIFEYCSDSYNAQLCQIKKD